MTIPQSAVEELQTALDALTSADGPVQVPGISVAVLDGDELVTLTSGVASVHTGLPILPQTLFRIASITKVYTATLVMQLVEEGRLGLDDLVTTHLPELKTADVDHLGRVTVRHLLTHAAGIEGDHFPATGRGDDAVAKYLETCGALEAIFEPGTGFSYCNAGFVFLGRIVEKLLDTTWDDAFATHIVERLGLTETVTLPEQALSHPVALGHVPDEEAGTVKVADEPFVNERADGPCGGGTVAASARDLVRFAAAHFDGEARLLQPATLRAMQEMQVDLRPYATSVDGWALGWERALIEPCVVGHGGNSNEQSSHLYVLPERRRAFAIVCNTNLGSMRAQPAVERFLQAAFGVALRERPSAPDEPVAVDTAQYVGRFGKLGATVDITDEDGALAAHVVVSYNDTERRMEMSFTPVDEHIFLATLPGMDTPMAVAFHDFDGARYNRLQLGLRLVRRLQ